MGHVGYYKSFFFVVDIACPLYKLLWSLSGIMTVNMLMIHLNMHLAFAPILRTPNWDLMFHVHIDASNFVIGCVLAQPREHKLDYAISFASHQLNHVDINCTTTEREGLGMVYAVKKFWHYLLAKKFKFYVDHQALLYLVNKPCTRDKSVGSCCFLWNSNLK